MAMSKHLSSDSSAYFRGLQNWQEQMAPILSRADEHCLIVNVHILALGDGEEQDQQRWNIWALVRDCVETAYGRKGGLTPSHFKLTRFVITLSQQKKAEADEVVGVILGDFKPYFFDLGFKCVAEHIRRKGLATLLFNAADTVIQCLARDMAGRKELPDTNDVYVVAHTDLDAPEWVEKFTKKMGFTFVEPCDPLEYCWGGGYSNESDDAWEKHIEY
jgi:hypothetical protein